MNKANGERFANSFSKLNCLYSEPSVDRTCVLEVGTLDFVVLPGPSVNTAPRSVMALENVVSPSISVVTI